MNNHLPYENKMIKEALSLIDRNKVSEYSKENKALQNYLVVYSGKYKKFFGIYASRYLRNNHGSARIIEDAGDISSSMRRLKRGLIYNDAVETDNNIQLFNYEEYLKDNKNDGFEILENHDKSIFGLKMKASYAVTYLKHPNIKAYAEKGYYRLIEDILRNCYDVDDILNVKPEGLRIDAQCQKFLNENEAKREWWIYLHWLNKNDSVSLEQLKYIYENNISINEIYDLVNDYGYYTVSNLIDYVNRCVMYQGLEHRRIIMNLSAYILYVKKHNIKANPFPNDLAKAFKCIDSMESKLVTYINTDYRNNYHYSYKRRNKYCFKDENYYIKAENDIDNVTEKTIILEGFDITQSIKKDTDYFWLCDTKTKREIALIRTQGKLNKTRFLRTTRKYRNTPLSGKEKTFLKKWLDYRKKIDLSLIEPQYNMA